MKTCGEGCGFLDAYAGKRKYLVSAEAIARHVGLSTNAVRTRLLRVRRKFSKMWGDTA